ncbi:anthranilate synthase component II [Mesonia aestuariivivens]|uniref:Aminodeoxychorismate/anthranilate synthase component II n=1 Tax=Mesonia aestuariivivens TaxID=2796128 RepID=A0ABS6VZ69_9FLAO|nr:aminodeoxychorismate/anthranilate synthase component II [Mesonia aestuariivivens]MBW2960893.1 aminodeoxychorismate/anthranilate synthase component II [Mesonia aestuariivivens]
MKKILVIDNYDSFVYNLVHYLEDLGCEVIVKRNNEIDLEEIKAFDRILLSPGPGIPSEAGLLNEIVSKYAPTKSILGVCLGQQAIGEVFGAKLNNLNQVFHGVATPIQIVEGENKLFKNLPQTLEVGRYHSWVVQDLPNTLIPTSYDENGQIMSLRHRDFQVYGVQFHPESVLTPQGKEMLKNWIEIPVKSEETIPA